MESVALSGIPCPAYVSARCDTRGRHNPTPIGDLPGCIIGGGGSLLVRGFIHEMNPYSLDLPAGPPDEPHSDPLIGSHLVRLPMTAPAAYTLGWSIPDGVRSRTARHVDTSCPSTVARGVTLVFKVGEPPAETGGLPAPSLTRQPSEGAYCHQRGCCRVIETCKDSK